MGRADALSRRPDHERGQDDNDGVILIEPHHLRWVDAEIEDEGDGLLEKIRHHRDMESCEEKFGTERERVGGV